MDCEHVPCGQKANVRFLEVRNRVLQGEKRFCEQHAADIWVEYVQEVREGTGTKSGFAALVGLELELIVDDRAAIQRALFREVGGTRTLILPIAFLEMCLLYYCLDDKSRYKWLFAHGTMARLVDRLGCSIERIVIDTLSSDGYFEARIWVARTSELLDVQVRPSDGLCLAIMSGTPFLIDESLLREYKLSQEDGTVSPV